MNLDRTFFPLIHQQSDIISELCHANETFNCGEMREQKLCFFDRYSIVYVLTHEFCLP